MELNNDIKGKLNNKGIFELLELVKSSNNKDIQELVSKINTQHRTLLDNAFKSSKIVLLYENLNMLNSHGEWKNIHRVEIDEAWKAFEKLDNDVSKVDQVITQIKTVIKKCPKEIQDFVAKESIFVDNMDVFHNNYLFGVDTHKLLTAATTKSTTLSVKGKQPFEKQFNKQIKKVATSEESRFGKYAVGIPLAALIVGGVYLGVKYLRNKQSTLPNGQKLSAVVS